MTFPRDQATRRGLWLLAAGLALVVLGLAWGDWELLKAQMAYGDFDLPGQPAFVQRLWTGTADLASQKVYRGIDQVKAHPLLILGGIFVIFFWLVRWRNPDRGWGFKPWLTYWICFVAARLGVFRVSGAAPVPRCSFGVFPFLNCQACEMATGACPIGMLQSSLMAMRLPVLAVGALVVWGAALGRAVCGWTCPFGMLADILDRFSLHRVKLTAAHGWLRYGVLVAVVVLPVGFWLAGQTALHPFCATLCPSGLVYGHLPFYATTGAPALAAAAGVQNGVPAADLGVFGFHLLVAVLFLAGLVMVSGWFFCHALCPLGAVLGLFNRWALVRVEHDTAKCSGCNLCVRDCPMDLQLGDGDFMTRSSCISCAKCISVCPDDARGWYIHPAVRSTVAAAQALVRPVPLERWSGAGTGGAEALPQGRTMTEVARGSAPADRYGLTWRGRLLRRLMKLTASSPAGLARFAKYHTAFYKRFYAGLDENDFRALPLLRKEEVRDVSPYDLLSDRYQDSVMYYGETTGSLGSPTPSFYTEREFKNARLMRHLSPYGPYLDECLTENRTAVNGLAFGFTVAGMSFGDVLASGGAMVANVGSRSTLATPGRIGRALVRLRPSVVAAAPIDFLSWARIAREDYPDRWQAAFSRLRVLMTTAELCSPQRVRRLEEHFGVVQINTYACVEGFFALACPCGRQHVLDAYDAEVLDERLERAAEFGTGRFAFTNLVKKSGPLIRYLLDDQVTIERCDCPYGYEKSIFPHGRWELSIVLGAERLNVAHFEDAIFEHGLFGDYRVYVHDDRLQVTLEDYAAPPEGAERVKEGLRQRFGLPVDLELVPFGKLTSYREVRASKPLLKLVDRRSSSTQQTPEVM